jgi:hypothetical protein
MFSEENLRKELRKKLPRGLQHIEISVMPPHLSCEPKVVIFSANGRCVELEVDPEIGLTCVDIVRLCVQL